MRYVPRAFLFVARVCDGLARQFHYFSAATMSIEEIKEGLRHSWELFNLTEYDIAQGLFPEEEDLVSRCVRPGDAVLVIGSGSGRDVIPLGERGCHVTCVEPASAALAIATRVLRERQLPSTMIEGFFEDVPLTGHFTMVMFSYYCYCYIPDSRRRIGVLRKAASHLVEGGHIVLGYPALPRRPWLTIWLAQAVGRVYGSDWRLEPGDNIVRQGSLYSYGHAFTAEEIAAEVAAAGLQVVYRNEFPAGQGMVLSVRA